MDTLLKGGLLTAAVALMAAPEAAKAQAAAPVIFEIEGPITDFDANAGTIEVMGVTINVPAGMMVQTPTSEFPLSELGAPMPGKRNGFVGGTGIVLGESLEGVVTATEVFTDLSENVVIGESTGFNDVERLTINGLPVRPIKNSRMRAAPVTDAFGFRINVSTVPAGTFVAAEGYLVQNRNGKVLYYHHLEAEAGELVNAGVPEVSINRAQCRDRGVGTARDELEVRGAVHLPTTVATGTAGGNIGLQIRFGASWQSVGTLVPVTADGVDPRFGEYRFNEGAFNFDGCPDEVRAEWINSGAKRAKSPVEARVD